MNTNTKNMVAQVIVEQAVYGRAEFTFTLNWLIKFYLYLLVGFSAGSIFQLEKMLVI